MERRKMANGVGAGMEDGSGGGGSAARTGASAAEVNYSSRLVQEALEHMASIDLVELCNEAKVEYCRATRDLRSCGRNVEYVLNSCGHAALCAECSQRCDVCPICRIPIPKSGSRLRLRLYYECIEAGLISKKYDDRFRTKDDDEKQLDADIQRLYSLFDVALKNNLASLICHYVTDVCMDETAVSSDPVIAFLLDEVVVKDWCKRTFKSVISELRSIYSLTEGEMQASLGFLRQLSAHLSGIFNVLEVLESSFKGAASAQLQDLNHLQENILKSKQHLEIMMWCLRHHFLEKVKSRFTSYTSWRADFCERKAAAIKRAMASAVDPSVSEGSLFIEDALLNLEGDIHPSDIEEELALQSLQKESASSVFRSKIDQVPDRYPFQNLHEACNLLFLHGGSDLVVAKRAIFLYFLYDRHWSLPNENWRPIVEDFAATFGIGRHSLLESLTFYLLDDHTSEALQEACRLLPEIAGPSTHPKVAQVLLERQNPDAALMVLRWSGRDCGSELVSLTEAVIAVRVRVLSGLLTEAFLYQRMICNKIKEKNSKHEMQMDASIDFTHGNLHWVETLVTELCCLCVWRNFLDQIIDLPWNTDEEKYLHKCLLEYATDKPTSSVGSLLVTFYLKRYRYVEAYQVDQMLKKVEDDCFLGNMDEKIAERMRSVRSWRTELIDNCLELLPQIQRQQVKSGKFSDTGTSLRDDIQMETNLGTSEVRKLNSSSILLGPSTNSTFEQWNSPINKAMESVDNLGTTRFSECINGPLSVVQERLFANTGSVIKAQMGISRNIQFDDTLIPGARHVSPRTTPSRKVAKTPSKSLISSYLQDGQFEVKQNGSVLNQLETIATPDSQKNRTPALRSRNYESDTFEGGLYLLSRKVLSSRPDRRLESLADEDMDITWSNGREKASPEEANTNGELRWRTDESSEDEKEASPQIATTSTRRARRSRLGRI